MLPHAEAASPWHRRKPASGLSLISARTFSKSPVRIAKNISAASLQKARRLHDNMATMISRTAARREIGNWQHCPAKERGSLIRPFAKVVAEQSCILLALCLMSSRTEWKMSQIERL